MLPEKRGLTRGLTALTAMNKALSTLIVVLLTALVGLSTQEGAAQVHSTADGLVLTPPMGW